MAVKIEIEFEILPDGSVRFHTHGLKGTKCDEELKPLEMALGKVKEQARTSEYYEKNAVTAKAGVHSKPK